MSQEPPAWTRQIAREEEDDRRDIFRAVDEESDRGVVIRGHSVFEDRLANLVAVARPHLTSASGKVAPKAHRALIEFARCHGVIGASTFADALVLLELRNTWAAHRRSGFCIRADDVWVGVLGRLSEWRQIQEFAARLCPQSDELRFMRSAVATAFYFACNRARSDVARLTRT